MIEKGQIHIVASFPSTLHAEPSPEPLVPSSCRVNFADKTAVRRAIDQKSALLLDVRSEAEYAGTDKERNPRHGHLPGAINLPHSKLLDTRVQSPTTKSKGRLKPVGELRRLFEEVGVTPHGTVITHCQSGGRAALAALALVYARHSSVSNYYPSFADWAADNGAPLLQPASTTAPEGRP